jgi:hypothetical protein
MHHRNIAAPLRAAEILLHLPVAEYRLALEWMAEYMHRCVLDANLTPEQTGAAKVACVELEKKLH